MRNYQTLKLIGSILGILIAFAVIALGTKFSSTSEALNQSIPNPETNEDLNLLGFLLVPNESNTWRQALGDTLQISFSKQNISDFTLTEKPNWFQSSDTSYYGTFNLKIPISESESLIRPG